MFIPNFSLKQFLSKITKMTSSIKWQHFSCLGLYLHLLVFLNIRKLAVSAQVTLHISNAIVNIFRLYPPHIPAGRTAFKTQASRAFIAARYYNFFLLYKTQKYTLSLFVWALLFAFF